MSDVVTFPVRPRRTRTVTPAEIYAAPKPSDEMVWNVCPYLLHGDERRCRACPEWEVDEDVKPYTEDGSGLCKRGCRMMAEEACRVVLAQQAKEAAHG